MSAEGGDKYFWYLDKDLIAISKNVKVRPVVPTQYRLQVENQYGCTASQPIEVDICCPPRLFVPNVITPDSRDQNSYMNIFGKNFVDMDLTVFNRWGEIIYRTKTPQSPWDGTYLNEPMPMGVYPWIITYKGECPEYAQRYQLTGDVTIVK